MQQVQHYFPQSRQSLTSRNLWIGILTEETGKTIQTATYPLIPLPATWSYTHFPVYLKN